ncbi:putative ankyrin repeat domain-containing protein 20A5 [Lemur catta]|uniref:putative ankyrin repeat domain-containing protein 20A5 n=1 Tax=Lemur catta TaxID=9447 RepID=UPI001E26BBEE|nr:putative ankyrin repeat domain-containing protein 20A5 [Lemur catta]
MGATSPAPAPAPSWATQPPPAEMCGFEFLTRGYDLRLKEMGEFHGAACRHELVKVKKMLYCNRTLPNRTDKKHRTALHLACVSRDAQVITFLLDKNCDLNPRDGENRTPLIKAVQCQAQECIILLLEHGADANVVDDYGNTALHYAAYNGDSSIAAKLVLMVPLWKRQTGASSASIP